MPKKKIKLPPPLKTVKTKMQAQKITKVIVMPKELELPEDDKEEPELSDYVRKKVTDSWDY